MRDDTMKNVGLNYPPHVALLLKQQGELNIFDRGFDVTGTYGNCVRWDVMLSMVMDICEICHAKAPITEHEWVIEPRKHQHRWKTGLHIIGSASANSLEEAFRLLDLKCEEFYRRLSAVNPGDFHEVPLETGR
jgi:hypothetical protein